MFKVDNTDIILVPSKNFDSTVFSEKYFAELEPHSEKQDNIGNIYLKGKRSDKGAWFGASNLYQYPEVILQLLVLAWDKQLKEKAAAVIDNYYSPDITLENYLLTGNHILIETVESRNASNNIVKIQFLSKNKLEAKNTNLEITKEQFHALIEQLLDKTVVLKLAKNKKEITSEDIKIVQTLGITKKQQEQALEELAAKKELYYLGLRYAQNTKSDQTKPLIILQDQVKKIAEFAKTVLKNEALIGNLIYLEDIVFNGNLSYEAKLALSNTIISDLYDALENPIKKRLKFFIEDKDDPLELFIPNVIRVETQKKEPTSLFNKLKSSLISDSSELNEIKSQNKELYKLLTGVELLVRLIEERKSDRNGKYLRPGDEQLKTLLTLLKNQILFELTVNSENRDGLYKTKYLINYIQNKFKSNLHNFHKPNFLELSTVINNQIEKELVDIESKILVEMSKDNFLSVTKLRENYQKAQKEHEIEKLSKKHHQLEKALNLVQTDQKVSKEEKQSLKQEQEILEIEKEIKEKEIEIENMKLALAQEINLVYQLNLLQYKEKIEAINIDFSNFINNASDTISLSGIELTNEEQIIVRDLKIKDPNAFTKITKPETLENKIPIRNFEISKTDSLEIIEEKNQKLKEFLDNSVSFDHLLEELDLSDLAKNPAKEYAESLAIIVAKIQKNIINLEAEHENKKLTIKRDIKENIKVLSEQVTAADTKLYFIDEFERLKNNILEKIPKGKKQKYIEKASGFNLEDLQEFEKLFKKRMSLREKFHFLNKFRKERLKERRKITEELANLHKKYKNYLEDPNSRKSKYNIHKLIVSISNDLDNKNVPIENIIKHWQLIESFINKINQELERNHEEKISFENIDVSKFSELSNAISDNKANLKALNEKQEQLESLIEAYQLLSMKSVNSEIKKKIDQIQNDYLSKIAKLEQEITILAAKKETLTSNNFSSIEYDDHSPEEIHADDTDHLYDDIIRFLENPNLQEGLKKFPNEIIELANEANVYKLSLEKQRNVLSKINALLLSDETKDGSFGSNLVSYFYPIITAYYNSIKGDSKSDYNALESQMALLRIYKMKQFGAIPLAINIEKFTTDTQKRSVLMMFETVPDEIIFNFKEIESDDSHVQLENYARKTNKFNFSAKEMNTFKEIALWMQKNNNVDAFSINLETPQDGLSQEAIDLLKGISKEFGKRNRGEGQQAKMKSMLNIWVLISQMESSLAENYDESSLLLAKFDEEINKLDTILTSGNHSKGFINIIKEIKQNYVNKLFSSEMADFAAFSVGQQQLINHAKIILTKVGNVTHGTKTFPLTLLADSSELKEIEKSKQPWANDIIRETITQELTLINNIIAGEIPEHSTTCGMIDNLQHVINKFGSDHDKIQLNMIIGSYEKDHGESLKQANIQLPHTFSAQRPA